MFPCFEDGQFVSNMLDAMPRLGSNYVTCLCCV